MQVIFTKHAKRQIMRRRVRKSQVLLVLEKPTHSIRLVDEPTKWDFVRNFRSGDRPFLHVVAYQRGKRFKVKTVYFSERR